MLIFESCYACTCTNAGIQTRLTNERTESTLAGRVYNYHSSTLLAFLHIDVTIRHQIADVKQAANHLDLSLLQL